MNAWAVSAPLGSIGFPKRETRCLASTLTLASRDRTFGMSAPKVRTDEHERSGKCGMQVGMFLGRLPFGTDGSRKSEARRRKTEDGSLR